MLVLRMLRIDLFLRNFFRDGHRVASPLTLTAIRCQSPIFFQCYNHKAMAFTKEELKKMAKSVPRWFHSIDLGQGVFTDGVKSREQMTHELNTFQIPDLRWKSVLDINTWDGYFAFAAEQRGAARVVAIDYYMWAMDVEKHRAYWLECKERGIVPAAYHTMPYYQPETMPGKAGFDTAKKGLRSSVEEIVSDFMAMDLSMLGQFDVVFYLGSLYHMENPLAALKRVAQVTKELAIIETEAVALPGFEHHALCEFFESNELNSDVSNWWAPNEKALTGLCRAAGFSRVKSVAGPPNEQPVGAITRYRSVIHAWK
jgi:tRNA (mo5U34)-methyltransferase